jgi:hypothetical protein
VPLSSLEGRLGRCGPLEDGSAGAPMSSLDKGRQGLPGRQGDRNALIYGVFKNRAPVLQPGQLTSLQQGIGPPCPCSPQIARGLSQRALPTSSASCEKGSRPGGTAICPAERPTTVCALKGGHLEPKKWHPCYDFDRASLHLPFFQ